MPENKVVNIIIGIDWTPSLNTCSKVYSRYIFQYLIVLKVLNKNNENRPRLIKNFLIRIIGYKWIALCIVYLYIYFLFLKSSN